MPPLPAADAIFAVPGDSGEPNPKALAARRPEPGHELAAMIAMPTSSLLDASDAVAAVTDGEGIMLDPIPDPHESCCRRLVRLSYACACGESEQTRQNAT